MSWLASSQETTWWTDSSTLSASDRYYRQDLTAPFVLTDGHLQVPTGPGIGVEPVAAVLEELTTSSEWVPP